MNFKKLSNAKVSVMAVVLSVGILSDTLRLINK